MRSLFKRIASLILTKALVLLLLRWRHGFFALFKERHKMEPFLLKRFQAIFLQLFFSHSIENYALEASSKWAHIQEWFFCQMVMLPYGTIKAVIFIVIRVCCITLFKRQCLRSLNNPLKFYLGNQMLVLIYNEELLVRYSKEWFNGISFKWYGATLISKLRS